MHGSGPTRQGLLALSLACLLLAACQPAPREYRQTLLSFGTRYNYLDAPPEKLRDGKIDLSEFLIVPSLRPAWA